MVLQKLPKILDNQVRCTGLDVLAQPLVDSDYVDELVGKVVLGPDAREVDSPRQPQIHH